MSGKTFEDSGDALGALHVEPSELQENGSFFALEDSDAVWLNRQQTAELRDELTSYLGENEDGEAYYEVGSITVYITVEDFVLDAHIEKPSEDATSVGSVQVPLYVRG